MQLRRHRGPSWWWDWNDLWAFLVYAAIIIGIVLWLKQFAPPVGV